MWKRVLLEAVCGQDREVLTAASLRTQEGDRDGQLGLGAPLLCRAVWGGQSRHSGHRAVQDSGGAPGQGGILAT